jgi:hypothetical protein
MFVSTHSLRVILTVACVFTIASALPFVARSQSVTETAPETSITNSPYTTEGVPGGDDIVGDFVVGPGKADVAINPGESKIVYMTVTNRTGEERRFNVTVQDAQGSQDPQTPIELLGDDRGPYSLKDYVSVPAETFILGHNQRARIPVTVSIPADSEPGGRYGSVLIDTVAVESNIRDSQTTVPQSAIIARVGTLFFVTIPGEVDRAARLKEFATIGKQTMFGGGPVKFGVLYENTGSIHTAPAGEVRITNLLGDEVGLVVLEPWFVLPKSERIREISWNREFLFGRYTATAQITRGYDGIVDTASFTFWVLPWKMLLGGFAAIFIVLFLTRAFFRTFEFKRKT